MDLNRINDQLNKATAALKNCPAGSDSAKEYQRRIARLKSDRQKVLNGTDPDRVGRPATRSWW